SVATDIEAIFAELPGNDRPYSVYLPAYAAVAWYHHMLPTQPAALEPFLTEVRAYAAGPFTAALLKGDAIPDAEREAVAGKMHEYTGLPAEYLKAANLRVAQGAFTHELQGATQDRGPTRCALRRRHHGSAGEELRLRSAVGGDQRRFRRGIPRLLPRRAQVRAGQHLSHHQLQRRRALEMGASNSEGRSADGEFRRRPRRGAGEGCEPAGAGVERLLRSRDALLRDRVRDGASRPASGRRLAHRDEVLRGGAHDVRASPVDGEDEARPGRVHRLDRAAVADRKSTR